MDIGVILRATVEACVLSCRHYDMKRHAAKKEQKTVDASEKVKFKNCYTVENVKLDDKFTTRDFDVVR